MKTTDVPLRPEMARARAEGRKSQTRRVIKPPLPEEINPGSVMWNPFNKVIQSHHDGTIVKCPYGQPGDRIRWLTTWAVDEEFDSLKPVQLEDLAVFDFWSYHDSSEKLKCCGRLRPGRFLPLFLRDRMPVDEIVSVRAERLQEITMEDCLAEGIVSSPEWSKVKGDTITPDGDGWAQYTIEAYRNLWESINGEGSWELNPWVWVIEFTRLTNADRADSHT